MSSGARLVLLGGACLVVGLISSPLGAEPRWAQQVDGAQLDAPADALAEEEPGEAPLGSQDSDQYISLRKSDVEHELKSVLEHRRYSYCQNIKYRLPEGEADLCAFVERQQADGSGGALCPSLARACQTKQEPTPEPAKPKRDWAQALGALAGVAQIVFWLLIAAIVGLVGFLIIRNFRLGKPAAKPQQGAPIEVSAAPEGAPAPLLEKDFERLLSLAQLAAAQGDFDGAVQNLHAALIRFLGHRRVLEVHPSLTNGDYIRLLRGHPELQAALRSSSREVEAVQFGARASDAGQFRRLLSELGSVMGRALAFALVGIFLLGNSACDSAGSSSEPRIPASNYGPGGVSALQGLLVSRGNQVVGLELPIEEIGEGISTLVIYRSAHLTKEEWSVVMNWVQDGGTLVLAVDEGTSSGHELSAPILQPCDGLQVSSGYIGYSGMRLAPKVSGHMMPSGNGMWSILECQNQGERAPYFVGHSLGFGSVLSFPDSRFLSNASLMSYDHAFIALDLIFPEQLGVAFLETGGHEGEDNPIDAVMSGKLMPLLFQLFLLMGVLYWWKGKHFASPTAPSREKRRAFREHVEALGARYSKAKASHLALSLYATWAIERLRLRCQPGSHLGLLPLATEVASRSGRPEPEVVRILVQASAAREHVDLVAENSENFQLMQELEALLVETGGIH